MTVDLGEEDQRPYFLWDEDVSVRELRERLAGPDLHERRRLLGKLLREARDVDVWLFVSPSDVAREFPVIRHRLGRRLPFWEFLLGGWRRLGILAG